MNTKFQKRDFFIIILCLLVATAAGIFELTNYQRAFPEHTIDFQVNRREAYEIASDFLAQMGIDPGDKQHASAFEFDNTAKVFIEKEMGIREADDFLTNHFRIWHWTIRWFKPLDREEVYVGVTPKGEITQFNHKIPEEAPAEPLSIDEARRKCHRFLTGTIKINPDKWEFIEDKTEVKPNRVDYRFTYKKKGVEVYDATYRFDVTVQGNTIGEYREYLHVPETWNRDYQRLRSLNATTATTAQIFFIILMLIIIVYFIVYLSRKQISLKTPLYFGLVTFLFKILSELNLLPLYKFHFDISRSTGAFYSDFLVSIFLQGLLLALVIAILTGAGELIYVRRYPRRLPPSRLFTLKGLQTKHFFFSILIGITLAIVFLAFQTMFYITAKRFGAWSPADISYSDTLNTAFPWILILFGGFLPAVLEEFSFRLFAIPFVEKLLKSRLLAILIPAVIWGFAHANYPNQPFWIRGFEVSIFGILVGFVFLKFGILTVLVWHYMVDAIYSSLLLFKTGEPYHVISASVALGIILLPVIYCLFKYFRNKGFRDTGDLLTDISARTPRSKTETAFSEESCLPYINDYQKLSGRKLKIILALIIGFILIQTVPTEKIGDYYRYPVPRSEIRQTAIEFLRNRGVDPEQFRNTITLVNNYSALKGRYILENSTVRNLNSILARYLDNSVAWQIRFFRPLDKEEYNVYVHPIDKSVVGFEHLLPENAEAFSINKDAARFRAEEYLTSRGLNLSDFELIEDYSRQLPNRVEHTFIWESRDLHPANAGDGRLRIRTVVSGDELSGYSISYKIPEEWKHNRTKKTLFDSLRLWLQILTCVIITVVTVVQITRRVKSLRVDWKTPLTVSAILGGLWLILEYINFPIALINYNTSWGLHVWTIFWILLTFLRVLAITLALFLLVLIVTTIYPRCQTTLRRDCRYHFSTDAIFTAVLVSSGIFAIQHLGYWLAVKFAPAVIHPGFQIPRSINYNFGALHALLHIVLRSIAFASIAGIVIFWFRQILAKQWLQVITAAILLALFIPNSFDNVREYLVLYIIYASLIAWFWISVCHFLKNNIPAYLYTGLMFTSLKTAENLISSKTPDSYVGALLILCLVTILIIWLLTEKKDFNIGKWLKNVVRRIIINKR